MEVYTINGNKVEISTEEVKRIVHSSAGGSTPGVHNATLPYREGPTGKAKTYAEKTHELMLSATNELREETGDYPEDLKELYDFAAKHELFGDRDDTHVMWNFLKLFYCMMQKETHAIE